LQTSSGTVTKSFPIETTLFEVAHALKEESGLEVQKFSTTFPTKRRSSYPTSVVRLGTRTR